MKNRKKKGDWKSRSPAGTCTGQGRCTGEHRAERPQPRAGAGHACPYLGRHHGYPRAGAWLYLRMPVFLQQPYDYTVITMTLLPGTANSTIIKKFISKSSWKLINFTAVSILSHCNKEKLSSRQIKSKLIALGESIQISLFHVRNLFLKQEEENQGEPARERCGKANH